jgi:signal transduction histidine kinase
MWNKVTQIGVNASGSWNRNRQILLSNRVSIILSVFTLLTFFVALFYFGWLLAVKLALAAAIIFLLPVLLNKLGHATASRMVLCALLSVATLVISVADKFDVPGQLEEFQYFQLRLMLLAAGTFPFILFQLEERKYWITAIAINLTCLIFYDPIHELFGVGYYQLGFTAPSYYFVNYMVVAAFIVLASSTYFLKKSFEEYEKKNEVLIKSLQSANNTIRHQREILEEENFQLNDELVNKNDQLMKTNHELIRHNNDLMQFSYSVSHNLRGPVASLIGLLKLLEQPTSGAEESRDIFRHVNRSLQSLDQIIKDLSSIIDIRNTVTEVKQNIILEDEVETIKNLLQRQIHDHEVILSTDFSEAPSLLSIRPMLSSILYNLISNAIKYRSPDRLPQIMISSTFEKNLIKIKVADNGLGIDLERFKEKLFGLYKRFHTHTEGKGLGLFLVKLQTEALGGSIDIESTPGEGTTFTISIKLFDESELAERKLVSQLMSN